MIFSKLKTYYKILKELFPMTARRLLYVIWDQQRQKTTKKCGTNLVLNWFEFFNKKDQFMNIIWKLSQTPPKQKNAAKNF